MLWENVRWSALAPDLIGGRMRQKLAFNRPVALPIGSWFCSEAPEGIIQDIGAGEGYAL